MRTKIAAGYTKLVRTHFRVVVVIVVAGERLRSKGPLENLEETAKAKDEDSNKEMRTSREQGFSAERTSKPC